MATVRDLSGSSRFGAEKTQAAREEHAVIATLDALNEHTAWLPVRGNGRNSVDIDIDGVYDMDITLERKKPEENDSAARAITSFSNTQQRTNTVYGEWDVRLNVTDYTSGSANVGLRTSSFGTT